MCVFFVFCFSNQSDNEGPFDVAKTDETRQVLMGWDPKKTEELKERRKRKMRAELEKRLKTTAEREALARELIRDELVEFVQNKVSIGLVDGWIWVGTRTRTNTIPYDTKANAVG